MAKKGVPSPEEHLGFKVGDHTVGRSRVILFGFPPHLRNQAHGTFKMLFNAIY